MKMVVLGETGQLARSLNATKTDRNVVFLNRSVVPFENFLQVQLKLEEHNPDLVINAVAYTKVDLAQVEKEKCFQINSKTPTEIAKWCEKNKKIFFHFSTDYVFDGSGEKTWVESDKINPLSIYGQSKAESEKNILENCRNAYIFRTSWVYSEFGTNFLKTMIKLFKDKKEITVVSDQVGAPNDAIELAQAIWRVVDGLPGQPGLYHLSSSSFCSWHEFAEKIRYMARELGFPLAIEKIHAISTNEYTQKLNNSNIAHRPLNSRLNSDKLFKNFGIQIPALQDSLKHCLERLKKLESPKT